MQQLYFHNAAVEILARSISFMIVSEKYTVSSNIVASASNIL